LRDEVTERVETRYRMLVSIGSQSSASFVKRTVGTIRHLRVLACGLLIRTRIEDEEDAFDIQEPIIPARADQPSGALDFPGR
jgi:hypothetical protein